MTSDILLTQLNSNFNTLSDTEIAVYYNVGWAAIAFILIFNGGYVIYFIIDVVIGFCYSNRERMEFPKRQYYEELLEEYEKYERIPNL